MGELGLLPREFWALTYAEFAAMAEGYIAVDQPFELAAVVLLSVVV